MLVEERENPDPFVKKNPISATRLMAATAISTHS